MNHCEQEIVSSDENFHQQIKKASEDGRVEIGIDIVALNRPGSPVYSWADHNLPGLVLLAGVIYIFYLFGWLWGGVSLFVWVVLLMWPIRKLGFERLRQRTLRYVLASSDNWFVLWEHGSLSLRLRENPSATCLSPKESWQDFVRTHLLKYPR